MIKTFKSADSPLEMGVGVSATGDVQVSLGAIAAVTITPSDAPALMQAIGEYLPPIPDIVRDGSYEAYMAVVAEYLDKAVRALEIEAELEAEALMLANSAVLAVGNPPYPSIEHMSDTSLRKWLAVARKAREMAKEATK